MILFPNAKINLGLHVLSKRKDNYHNLETLMHPVGLYDILEFLPSRDKETIFKVSGISISGDMEDNLVYKAYKMLKDRYNLPELKIHLHKMIPAGAGLGGGSSDAAFMLKGLNQFFGLQLSTGELQNYAALLGSDCSFFIMNEPALVSGRGEILSPADNYVKNLRLLLFYPGFHVSTAEAYGGIVPDPGRESLVSILNSGIQNWRKTLTNDFEKSIFEKYPVLHDLKEKLYESGAVYASMSGSGSAVYGLFEGSFRLPPELEKFRILTSPGLL